MNQSNSIELINRTNLTEQAKFRLNKLSEIGNYFFEEVNQRKSCSKKLSKYVATFDYIDKVLIVLNVTSSGYLFVRLRVLLMHQLELQVQVLL